MSPKVYLAEFGNHGCGKTAVWDPQKNRVVYKGECPTCDDLSREGASPLNSGATTAALFRQMENADCLSDREFALRFLILDLWCDCANDFCTAVREHDHALADLCFAQAQRFTELARACGVR